MTALLSLSTWYLAGGYRLVTSLPVLVTVIGLQIGCAAVCFWPKEVIDIVMSDTVALIPTPVAQFYFASATVLRDLLRKP